MGHENLKMILERHYSYIKNYHRDNGSEFLYNAYNPSVKKDDETSDEVKNLKILHQFTPKRKKGIDVIFNFFESLDKLIPEMVEAAGASIRALRGMSETYHISVKTETYNLRGVPEDSPEDSLLR